METPDRDLMELNVIRSTAGHVANYDWLWSATVSIVNVEKDALLLF